MNPPQTKRLQPRTIINLADQNACRMRWVMIQRALGVALLVCLCSGMAQGRAQECGDNPMKQVLLVAKRAGRSLTHVLTLLRDIDGGAYDTLSQKFRLYAACVGLVDTGYFRKRSGATLPMVETGPGARMAFSGHHIRVRDIEIANNELPFNMEDGEVAVGMEAPTRPPPSPQSRWPWRQALMSTPQREIRLWMSRTQANLTSNLKSASSRTRPTQEDAEDAIMGASKSLR